LLRRIIIAASYGIDTTRLLSPGTTVDVGQGLASTTTCCHDSP
jgi:hypothetical protein